PDLEDSRLGRLQIIFGVADAAAGAHHLYVARFGPALVAEAVLMRDRALADIGDDFHVGVGVRRKAGVRRDLVVVPHPKRAVTHIVRVVMAAEREVVLGLEPAVVGGAELRKWPEFDHGMFLCLSIFSIGCNFDGLWIGLWPRYINRNYRNSLVPIFGIRRYQDVKTPGFRGVGDLCKGRGIAVVRGRRRRAGAVQTDGVEGDLQAGAAARRAAVQPHLATARADRCRATTGGARRAAPGRRRNDRERGAVAIGDAARP